MKERLVKRLAPVVAGLALTGATVACGDGGSSFEPTSRGSVAVVPLRETPATVVQTTTPDAPVVTQTPTTTEAQTTTTETPTTTEAQHISSILGALEVGNFKDYRVEGSLDYPGFIYPDPSREPVFPDVPKGNRPAQVAYETPFESGDYFQTGHGDIDVPQYYYRVVTAGTIKIPQLGIDCVATPEKGCAVIIINHFGDTEMFRDTEVDNGFTVAGRVFDMSTPDKVTTAGQALLDHYMGRMTESADGANCSTIGACPSVEYYVAITGNGQLQMLTGGIYQR
jgi:hypothetical protein